MVNVLHDRVLIKKIDATEVSTGGILLTHGNIEQTFEGEVIAVGKGRPIKDSSPIPLTVKVGDRVMYNPKAGIAVKVKDEQLLVMKEEEIFAIIEDDTK
jgi:chaperonin GroES